MYAYAWGPMVDLGGGAFLMSEVHLYCWWTGLCTVTPAMPTWDLQGYLAHKTPHPPRALQ